MYFIGMYGLLLGNPTGTVPGRAWHEDLSQDVPLLLLPPFQPFFYWLKTNLEPFLNYAEMKISRPELPV
jgi:hypothetical protein